MVYFVLCVFVTQISEYLPEIVQMEKNIIFHLFKIFVQFLETVKFLLNLSNSINYYLFIKMK